MQTEQCTLSGSFAWLFCFFWKKILFLHQHKKLNEPELRRDIKDFCHSMRLKWYFSELSSFSPKSSWRPQASHLILEVFISVEMFRIPDKNLTCSSLNQEEWQNIRSLADDRSIVLNKYDKGSCVVVWDRYNCLSEAQKNNFVIKPFIKMFHLMRKCSAI